MKNVWVGFIGIILSCQVNAQNTEQSYQAQAEKITALLYHIENSYVDSVDTEALVDDAIREVLEDLDPHSVYIPAKDLQQANEGLEGNFEGIGIQFNILRDTITVVSPISGGPSEKLGIVAGDKILTIDGELVAGTSITNKGVADRLRGDKGTKVSVGIKRRGSKKPLEFEITRDEIPIYSLDAAYMATDKIGYIKLNRFAKTTMTEFYTAMSELQEMGMEDLILDLQGNGGGMLETSIQLADQFLSAGELIVYTEGRAYPRRDATATAAGTFESGRLVVLIDEGSASASEIVSGAIQDWDRGLIMGRRSFGKGLVQRPIPLPDGSAVRLTIQKYYTPSGRCIQKPYTDGLEAYQMEKYERYTNGELWSIDSLDTPDSLKYFTEMDRVVYGGGGITPDIFIAIDTSQSSELNTDLIRTGIMNSFAITYTNSHRDEFLSKYNSVNEFAEGVDMDAIIRAMKKYSKQEDDEFEWKEDQYLISEQMIKGRLKGLIARNLWDNSAYYEVFNPYWPTYQSAIEVLQQGNYDTFKLAAN